MRRSVIVDQPRAGRGTVRNAPSIAEALSGRHAIPARVPLPRIGRRERIGAVIERRSLHTVRMQAVRSLDRSGICAHVHVAEMHYDVVAHLRLKHRARQRALGLRRIGFEQIPRIDRLVGGLAPTRIVAPHQERCLSHKHRPRQRRRPGPRGPEVLFELNPVFFGSHKSSARVTSTPPGCALPPRCPTARRGPRTAPRCRTRPSGATMPDAVWG